MKKQKNMEENEKELEKIEKTIAVELDDDDLRDLKEFIESVLEARNVW